jgi:hypothetical protein
MIAPSCVRNRWGTGTCTPDKPTTSASKEMNDKLAAIQAERQKQDDKFWAKTQPEPQVKKTEQK